MAQGDSATCSSLYGSVNRRVPDAVGLARACVSDLPKWIALQNIRFAEPTIRPSVRLQAVGYPTAWSRGSGSIS